jgi:hypothetical protein
MPTWDSLAAYGRELKGLESDLTGAERQKITRQMGVEAQRIADREAASDLGGDRAFSGWNRGRPIPLDTRLRPARDGATMMTPKFPGGWTVAEFGRNSKAGPRLIGPRLTRTGRVSRQRQRRYNGTTRGKRTASDAVKVMEARLPKIADKGVRAVTRKRFDVT